MIEVQNPREQFGQNKMLPPPVGTFQTPEELLKHIQDFVLTQGYMVSIKDFSKDRYVIIACEGGGVYHKRLKCGDNMHEQKAPSRLINCPFEVVGKKDNDLWKLTIEHGEHNHEPSENTSDQLSSRCFTEQEVLVIREMTAAGKQPNKILKVLRQRNPNLMSDPRIVYSVKAMIRREMSSGKKMESPPSSGVFDMNGVMGLEAPSEQMVANGTAMGGSIDQAYIESDTVKKTRALASDLCRQFYTLGWLSGTGGSITIKVHDDLIPKPRQLIVMSPSGVQKEMMFPEDFYVCFSDGFILSTPLLKPYPHNPPTCTDCAPLFMKAYEMRNSGAVIHSHGMASCLVTMINPFSKEFKISHMEMIKGIQGHGYHDELVVPIIENTAHERELIGSFTEAIKAYPKATAVLVRNHGVFIWGDSWISAKTQAECYHYIFYAAIKLHQLGLDWSTPNHSCVCSVTRTRECGGNVGRDLKTGALGIDYAIEHKHRFILLDMVGTTTPTSFTTDVLFPYANNKFLKHLEAAYDCEDTYHDISLLRWQAIIRTDREVTALEQLQGLISKSGFARKELAGVVFDDVSVALQRWNALGVKVYIRSTSSSSSSREADQLLLANSTYGDLRKYICGYFDTTIGSQKDSKSYVEILETVGVDRPSDILFVTATLQEADAARAAGLEVMISIRPGNEPLPENHGFKVIESFLTI